MKRVYLCGPINGCNDTQARTWREEFKARSTDLELVDPMKRDYRGKEAANYREIVDLDKLDIRSCDVVVVMYVQPSVGTSMEVFYAWTLGIPVIVIDQSGKPLSPWLKYHSTAIVETIHEVLTKIEQW